MRILRFLFSFLLFVVFTVVTQVGGFIYLLAIGLGWLLSKNMGRWLHRFLVKLGLFVGLYLLCTFAVIPAVAPRFGRVALPVFEAGHLQALHWYTCLFNRHYVRPALAVVLTDAAVKLYSLYPGSTVNFLDAGFPFLNGFPLLPHLSHNDGRKADLAFRYTDAITGKPVNGSPSFWGYGVSEEPTAAEINTTVFCAMKGYKQYDALGRYVTQRYKKDYRFDAAQTRALINSLVANKNVQAVFIEPHLKTRMDLVDAKVKFQGCHSVRHDDHIHIQIK